MDSALRLVHGTIIEQCVPLGCFCKNTIRTSDETRFPNIMLFIYFSNINTMDQRRNFRRNGQRAKELRGDEPTTQTSASMVWALASFARFLRAWGRNGPKSGLAIPDYKKQTCRGPLSALSQPTFATKHSVCNIFRDLQSPLSGEKKVRACFFSKKKEHLAEKEDAQISAPARAP